MRKNGIKNFIFSFAISLLAVFAVNKTAFHTQKNNNITQKEIKTKSISLFSKQNDDTQNDEIENNLHNMDKLVAKEALQTANSVANLPEINIEPQVLNNNINNKQASSEVVYSPEIEKENNIQAPSIDHAQHINLASASEIILEKEQIISEASKAAVSSIATNAPVVYSDISDTIEDETKLDGYKNTSFVVADSKSAINFNEPAEDAIPLVQNDETLHDNINVLTSAQNTQIAMLEPNTLVNSIESIEKEEEKNISEVNLKEETIVSSNWIKDESAVSNTQTTENVSVLSNWKQMSEEEEDSPWVVAKGNRFAKNKIAQIDALAEEEAEKKKKSKKDDQKEKSSETIKENSQNETVVEKETLSENKKTETSEAKLQQTNSIEKPKENVITAYDENKEPKAQYTYVLPKPIFNYYTINQSVSSETQKPQAKQEAEPEENKDTNKDKVAENVLNPKPLLIPSDGKKTKLAYNPIPNLIIPLPDDIANDTDITPQLSSEPKQSSDKDLNKEEKESGLFKSISSWFSSDEKDKEKEEENGKDKKNSKKPTKKKKSAFSLFESKSDPKLEEEERPAQDIEIMPAELKLSFQPNRAEISGHTLRWIHAFADNARDNLGIYIEIRIDGTSSFALQQKRLNLLSSIFANRGVDFRKVNIVFTSREPNSFIIRNIKFNNSEEIIVNKDKDGGLYQHW
jgi:hypothetical protein